MIDPDVANAPVIEQVEYDPYGRVRRTALGDFDHDGAIATADIFANLAAFYGPSPAADHDWDGAVAPSDIFAFLAHWFAADSTPRDQLSSSGNDNPIGYCGYYHERETVGIMGAGNGGLYQVRHRVYDPHAGRWLQRDPAGFVDGCNLYEYCTSSPRAGFDPWGLDERLCSDGTVEYDNPIKDRSTFYYPENYAGGHYPTLRFDDVVNRRTGEVHRHLYDADGLYVTTLIFSLNDDHAGAMADWMVQSDAFIAAARKAGTSLRITGELIASATPGLGQVMAVADFVENPSLVTAAGFAGILGGLLRLADDVAEIAARAAGAVDTRFIAGVRAYDKVAGKWFEGTVDLKPTLDRLKSGLKTTHRRDGGVYRNLNGRLPQRPAGYYHEFVVDPPPGGSFPGMQRLVIGRNGEMWYTPDHYETFIPVK